MEEYMTKTREDYGLSIARPKINEKAHFELKCQFLKELRDNTFSGSDNEDANKHIVKGLEIVDLFHIPDVTQDMQEVILFYKGLDVPTRQILDSKDAIPTMKGIDTSNGLAAIQAHLNNLRREIKKVNEKVYAAQVGCESCSRLHYTKDCPLKKDGKILEEAYNTQFGVPFLQGGRYRAASLGIYQRDNGNSSGSGSLLGSTETNLRDHVKSISITVETDTPSIHQKMALVELMYRKESANNLKWLLMEKLRMGYQIEVSTNMHDSLILEDSLPTKEKDSGSLGELTPTKLIIILADRTMKHPKGIAENLLVGKALILYRSLDPMYGDYIKLTDLNKPLELKRNQVEDLGPTIEEGEVVDEPMEDIVKTRNDDNEISDGIDELP
ncbi:hypothetical protein Tco_1201901 [Tanacetum coccineum]